MSVIEEALQKILVDDGGVGTLAANRIYNAVLPQGATVPAITWQRIATPRLRDLDGAEGSAQPRFQINCWGDEPSEPGALANAVRAALQDYEGTVLAVYIKDIWVEDEGDLFEAAVGNLQRRRYGRRLDIIVWHEE